MESALHEDLPACRARSPRVGMAHALGRQADREQWRPLGVDASFGLRGADYSGRFVGTAMRRSHNRHAAKAAAASREKNCLRMAAVDKFAQRARSFARQSQLYLGAFCLACLTACASDTPPPAADFGSGSVGGFAGAVAADEPRAVLVARDVLSGGGSAVAAYFTMAVTLPSTAGLGGGGACLVHDAKKKTVEAIVFMPLASADGQFGMPVNIRGMALLQARHGRLHWAELLGPAEDLAEHGTAISRALAREIITAGDKLRGDPELARMFVAADGHLLGEGENLVQPELGSIIGQIRIRGAGDFYVGGVAQRLTESAQSAGLALTAETLRGALPQAVDPLVIDFGGQAAYFTPPPADGGLAAAELLALLSQTKSWSDASASECSRRSSLRRCRASARAVLAWSRSPFSRMFRCSVE